MNKILVIVMIIFLTTIPSAYSTTKVNHQNKSVNKTTSSLDKTVPPQNNTCK